MQHALSQELLAFLDASPTCFHAVKNLADRLDEAGFTPLTETEVWELSPGSSYYVERNGSALIAFTIPTGGIHSWRVSASHSDSPCLKLKENPELAAEGHYVRLNVEGYGGMIVPSWFDRPLSLAGRVIVRANGELQSRLINFDRDMLLIPSVAPHFKRAGEKDELNMQTDLLPIYGDGAACGTFLQMIAESVCVSEENLLGHDLFVYPRQKGSVWGPSGEFIASPRLDDLQCAFACFKGFLAGQRQAHASMFCLFDNEEVGSLTRQGAASTFLRDTLERICESLGMSRQAYLATVAGSLMVSADNAHAVHPAHPEKSDPANRPYLNEGIVLKYNAAQNYCTDGLSGAMFKDICRRADVPYQVFTNRSDRRGGGTLGNLSTAQVPFPTVDLGLPQLAMHAPYEMAGTKDTLYLKRAMQLFFA